MNEQSTIRIPESVLSYMTDELVRSAVHQLLEKDADNKLPGDLSSWNDLRAYNRALLSAQQVKFEYVDFLHELWDRIWGTAQRQLSESFSVMELTDSRTELFCDDKSMTYIPSSRYLWDKEYSLDKCLIASGGDLITAGMSYNLNNFEEGLRIFTADNSEFDLSIELALNRDEWSKELDDGWLNTLPKLVVPKPDQYEVDISVLQQAAHSMLCAYRDHFLK
nr:hypothetical protein [uncultured Cohaesibacter sp.]